MTVERLERASLTEEDLAVLRFRLNGWFSTWSGDFMDYLETCAISDRRDADLMWHWRRRPHCWVHWSPLQTSPILMRGAPPILP